MYRRPAILALFATALFAAALFAAGTADAYPYRDRVAAGTLECRSPGTISLIVSSTEYDCRFHAVNGRTYRYGARISRIGLEAGVTGEQVLLWRVFAPTSKVDRKALRGGYGGAHAGIGVILGLGGNVLVGGSGNTISLQPISVEATTGINFAISAAGLTLY